MAQKATQTSLDITNASVIEFNDRVDNIIATPTTVSEQEIIDARQGKASLGANLTTIKQDLVEHKVYEIYCTEKVVVETKTKGNTPNLDVLNVVITGNVLAFNRYGGLYKVLINPSANLELTHNQMLVWDFSTNTLVVQAYDANLTSKNVSCLLLCHNGEIKTGSLKDYITVSTKTVKHINYNNPMTFTRNTVTSRLLVTFGSGDLSAFDEKGNIAYRINPMPKTSYNIGQNQMLVWNIKTNLLSVIPLTDLNLSLHLVLIHNYNATPRGGFLANRFDYLSLVKNVHFSSSINFIQKPTMSRMIVRFEEGDLSAFDVAGNIAYRINFLPVTTIEIFQNYALVWNISTNDLGHLSITDIDPSIHLVLFHNYNASVRGGYLAYRYTSELEETKKRLLINPPYVRDLLESTADKIANLQGNTMSFGFISDTHQTDIYDLYHNKNIAEISKYIDLDFICHGGDSIIGDKAKTLEISYLSKGVSLLNEAKCPVVILKGDHDDNNWYSRPNGNLAINYIKNKEFYNRTMRHAEKHIITGGTEKMYGYKDDDKTKIRTIFVNTSDFPEVVNPDGTMLYNSYSDQVYGNEQLNWIANVALNFSEKATPSDWAVIVLGHKVGSSVLTNHSIFMGILNAYKLGTPYTASGTNTYETYNVNVDFTTQGEGDVICMVRGHTHMDSETTLDGIKIVGVLNSQTSQQEGSPSREMGTNSEDAWDIFTINRETRTIYATRFGAGIDRVISY